MQQRRPGGEEEESFAKLICATTKTLWTLFLPISNRICDIFYMRQMWVYNIHGNSWLHQWQRTHVYVWGGYCKKRFKRRILLTFKPASRKTEVIFHLNVRLLLKVPFVIDFISISLQITREVQCTQMAAGQNKNQTVFLFLAHMQWSGTYDVIHHKYLVIHFPDTGTIKKRSWAYPLISTCLLATDKEVLRCAKYNINKRSWPYLPN